MYKFYIFLLVIVIIACNNKEKQGVHKDLWTFEPAKNNPKLDELCIPIIHDYEVLIQCLIKNDTSDLKTKAKDLLLKLDTVSNSYTTNDTVMYLQFKSGLMNIQDEIQGVILEKYPEDLNIAMNMVSIQLLHLLGGIGFNKQSVYIFNANGNNANVEEDGLIWLSLNKKSINPYYNIKNELVTANYILQEN
jgi:hypothetical protein